MTNGAELSQDWHGKPLRTSACYQLMEVEEGLLFRVGRAVVPGRLLGRRGEFFEGLWEAEAGELFLMVPGKQLPAQSDECYLEVNLGPMGAFWVMAFDGVRQRRVEALELTGVRANGAVERDGWWAELLLPWLFLSQNGLDLENLHGDVCFVCEEEKGLAFASLNADSKIEPDFHRPSAWGCLEVVKHGGFSGTRETTGEGA